MINPIASPTDPRWSSALSAILSAAEGATVVWDFDGVIADSEPVHAQSYRVLLMRRGFKADDDFFAPLIGHTEREIWRMLHESGAPVDTDVDALVAERRKAFLCLAAESLSPSWLAAELVPRIAQLGVSQHVVSNGDPVTIRTMLDRWGLGETLLVPNVGDGRAPVTGKRERLEAMLRAGPAILIEDNADYLALGRSAGGFCIAVYHGMSSEASLHGDVEVVI